MDGAVGLGMQARRWCQLAQHCLQPTLLQEPTSAPSPPVITGIAVHQCLANMHPEIVT